MNADKETRRLMVAAAVLLASALLDAQTNGANRPVSLTAWTKSGVEYAHTLTTRSPDGTKVFSLRPARGGTPIIKITANGKPVRHDVQYMSQAELLWSPASNGFAIESTSAGSYDGWTLQVFLFRGDRLEEHDVGAKARQDLAREFPQCIPGDELNPRDCASSEWGEVFNVLPLKWLSGTRLLLGVEIPCSTGYGPNFCRMKAYEVEVPSGKILAAYSQAEAHRRYPALVKEERERSRH